MRCAILATPAPSCSFSQCTDAPLISVDDPDVTVRLRDIRVLHYSLGEDLWNGNCGLFVSQGCADILRCSFQSNSGRGLVISNGGSLFMSRCAVHDCAATGIYVGDAGSNVSIADSKVVRNGRGGEHVPPGHSGVYVENAHATVRGCLVGFNYLTGISVVRYGHVGVYRSDVYANSAAPLSVEEEEDGSTITGESNNYDPSATVAGSPGSVLESIVLHDLLENEHKQDRAFWSCWNNLSQFLDLNDLFYLH
mmetsp:Transcript_32880/g.75665  ORF Transcript_32880/g.75665 Transcript_32880/m.75665 type:complete len:251 (-) Transcript_32880:336-1088(-)